MCIAAAVVVVGAWGVGGLRSVAGYLGLSLVFVWGWRLGPRRGEGLIAIFRGAFASTNRILILAGESVIGIYHVYK